MLAWPDEPQRAKEYTRSVFSEVAPRYDVMKQLMSFGLERRWKTRVIQNVPAPKSPRMLDLATGTGDIAAVLHERHPTGVIMGADISLAMVDRARQRVPCLADSCVIADLDALPFKRNAFDVVSLGYGLRYVTDLRLFLRAVRSLLRGGGAFVSYDLGRMGSPALEPLWQGYLLSFGTALGLLLHRRLRTYWHIVESLRSYPGQRAVTSILEDLGFEEIRQTEFLGGAMVGHVAQKPA